MKKIIFGVLAMAGAASLCACTSEQAAVAVAGVSAACTLATAGTTVYVQVESSSGGATAQNISKQVSGDVATDCPVLTSAVQTAVNAVVASGATATVTVSSSTPATTPTTMSARRHVIAKVRFKSTPNGVAATYVVKPDLPVPFLGSFF